MATTGESFGIAAAIYGAICLGVLLAFDVWRRLPFWRQFYSPRRYMRGLQHRPKRLPARPVKWILAVLRQSERDVINTAGVDAAMYLKVLRCGLELFFVLSLFLLIFVLPVNWTGDQVEVQQQQQATGTAGSNWTYWVPSDVRVQEEEDSGGLDQSKPTVVEPPDFYVDNIPPAPPGLVWWEYQPDVPLLPEPAEVLGPNYTRYGWRYDATFQDVQYRFSDLDKATMANVAPGSSRLWVHAVAAWLVSAFTLWHLYKYNREAVRLRIYYLLHTPPGAESHTVLLTDIPGPFFGTVLHRVDKTVLRFLPERLKRRLAAAAAESAARGLAAVKGLQQSVVQVVARSKADGKADPLAIPSKAPPAEDFSQVYFDATSAEPSAPSANFAGEGSQQLQRSLSAELPGSGGVAAGGASREGGQGDSSPGTIPAIHTGFGTESQGQQQRQQRGSGNLPPGSYFVADNSGVAWRSPSKALRLDPWQDFMRRVAGGCSVEEVVEQELREVYGRELSQVHLVRDTSALDPVVKEYQDTLQALTDLAADYTARRRRGRPVKPHTVVVLGVKYGRWGLEKYGPKPAKVDQLLFLRDRAEELWRVVQEEQGRAMDRVTPSAFVTFKTRQAQVIAADALLCRDAQYWRCKAAPGPGEVVWKNLEWRLWERAARQGGAWAAFFLLALFFMIPVTAVQGLLSLNSLTEWLSSYPVFNALLAAILPGLALKIFLLLLPWVISTLNHLAGMTSKSDIDLGVVTRYFIFQTITVFFGSFIAGSFANQLRQFIDNPSSIITVLGTAAPQTAIFFMTYLLLQALLSKPLSLLRLVDLVKFWLASRMAATERAKARAWQEQTLKYGTLVPDDTIAILLGLVFCIICPLIAPVALAYFCVSCLVWKYQVLYVYQQEYQSGGKVWTRVFDQVCFALLMLQLIMMGILGIKRAVGPPLMVLPLPFITLVYWVACRAMFWRPQEALALADAAALDAQDREQGLAGQQEEEMGGPAPASAASLYLSPSFKLSEPEFRAALQVADSVLAWLRDKGQAPQDIEAGAPEDEAQSQVAEQGLPGGTQFTASCIDNALFEGNARVPGVVQGSSGGNIAEGPGIVIEAADDVLPRAPSGAPAEGQLHSGLSHRSACGRSSPGNSTARQW